MGKKCDTCKKKKPSVEVRVLVRRKDGSSPSPKDYQFCDGCREDHSITELIGVLKKRKLGKSDIKVVNMKEYE